MYNPKDGLLFFGFGVKWSNFYTLFWFLRKIDLYINVEKHEGG